MILRKVTLATIWLMVFAIPWENMIVFPMIGSLSRITGVLALGIGILALISLNAEIRLHRFHALLLLFIIWGSLTFYWSVDQSMSMSRLATYAQLLLMTWLVYQWADDCEAVLSLLVAYVLGCYVSVISIVMNFIEGTMVEIERYSAIGFNPNDLSIILVMGIPMAWYLSLKRKGGRLNWLFAIYPFLSIFCIALTGSRNGLIAGSLAFAYVLWTSTALTLRYRFVLYISGLVTVIVGIVLLPPETWQRWATIGTELSEGTLNERLTIWTAGFKAFLENPMVGNGIGAFKTAVTPFLGTDKSAHNVYLAILVEMGLIGIIIFLAILASAFISALRMPRHEKLFWVTLLSVCAVSAMSLNWEWRKQTWLYLVFVAAHATALNGRQSRTGDAESSPLEFQRDDLPTPGLASKRSSEKHQEYPPAVAYVLRNKSRTDVAE